MEHDRIFERFEVDPDYEDAPKIPRKAKYGSRILDVLHYAGENCFVLLDQDGARLTVHRSRLTFIK